MQTNMHHDSNLLAMNIRSLYPIHGEVAPNSSYDVLCFSEVTWGQVAHRVQHLMRRFANERRVFYVEKSYHDAECGAWLEIEEAEPLLLVVKCHLPKSDANEGFHQTHHRLIDQLLQDYSIRSFICWYDSPSAFAVSDHLSPLATIYDCKSDVPKIAGKADIYAIELEKKLLAKSTTVFTASESLYEVKRAVHPHVVPCLSGVDLEHFRSARCAVTLSGAMAKERVGLKIGYMGTVDDRIDWELVESVAKQRPKWELIFIGEIRDGYVLPKIKAKNIKFLGALDYDALPSAIKGWDVAMLPYSCIDATSLSHPTSISEYLAAGKRVVSTPLRDIVNIYGKRNLVSVAEAAGDFVAAVEKLNASGFFHEAWLDRVDEFLTSRHWDDVWRQVSDALQSSIEENAHRWKRRFFHDRTANEAPLELFAMAKAAYH